MEKTLSMKNASWSPRPVEYETNHCTYKSYFLYRRELS